MKSIISYFAVIVAALFYMLFFDARSGSVMLYFLIAAIIISVSVTLNVRKHISFSITVPAEPVRKRKDVSLCIHAHKDTFVPAPLVTVYLSVSGGIDPPAYTQYRFSMAEKKDIDIVFSVFPFVSGLSSVKIEKIEISDYLGIFRFKVKKFTDAEQKLSVCPDIPEIENNTDLLRIICDSVTESDDDSDTVSASLPGLPGYEYREYVPGDPLRKVNWKMSSKKRKLYVRLDEAAGVSIPDIILDNSVFSDDMNSYTSLVTCDRITEASLAVMMACVKNGISCNFSYISDGKMVSELVSVSEDVEKIAEKLSCINFDNHGIVSEEKENKKTSVMNIIFTAGISSSSEAYAALSVKAGNTVRYVIPDISLSESSGSPDMWIVHEDYSITRSC